MKETKYIKDISFQLCSVPDSEGLVLEALSGDDAFLEIRVDSNDVQWVRFFSSEKHFAITINDMEKAIEIAKKEVVNTTFDL